MRSIGVGINLYANDHNAIFPGPLWPGQVVQYSKVEEGRLVVRLAPYLGIEEKDTPYVATRFLPTELRKALPSVAPEEIRVFVMNMAVPSGTGTVNPWGTLTPSINAPLGVNAIPKLSTWALSEAYVSHPAVTSRPWKINTAPAPLYGKRPMGLFFDGSVEFFDPAGGL